jgi:DNA adenine methylase
MGRLKPAPTTELGAHAAAGGLKAAPESEPGTNRNRNRNANHNLEPGTRNPEPRVRPLLKWAGGKRQLLPVIREFYPQHFTEYVEPFFGSGAVFFDLCAAGRLDGCRVRLADANPDLVGCYKMLRDRTDEVIAVLEKLAAGHRLGGDAFFYEVRDTHFNPARARANAAYTPELAAMLIYLNRTGFNGLFRLNRRGEFNVPAGRYANPRIVDPAHLRHVASALRGTGVTMARESFEASLASAGRGAFVYCDPPYAPLSRTASFANYTADGFGVADQERLRNAIVSAAGRGAAVVVSNSSAPLIEPLYTSEAAHRARLRVVRVPARRAINSRAASRGPVDELLITNIERRPALAAADATRSLALKPKMARAELRQRAARAV